MDEEITKIGLCKWMMLVALLGVIAVMTIHIAELKNRLDVLERHQEEQDIAHKTELDCTNLYIESVKNDLTASIDEQQKQIDSQAEQILKTKQIVSTTNKAFTRFQQQSKETEEEIREELKKD